MKKIMFAALLLALALLPACGWAEDIFAGGTHYFSKDTTYSLENKNGEKAISLEVAANWRKADDVTDTPTVTLILKGENTINLTTLEARISATGVNVTIKADPADPDASLEIIKDFSGDGSMEALGVEEAKLTIESGNVTVRNDTWGSAIWAKQLEVSGGSLTAASQDSSAIGTVNMTVSGGEVTATSQQTHGIWLTGPLTISGGSVTATGGERRYGISGNASRSIKLDGVTASHSDDGKTWEAYTGGSVKRYFKSPSAVAAADSAASSADLPQTGDSSALLAWAALLGASCLLLRRRAMN